MKAFFLILLLTPFSLCYIMNFTLYKGTSQTLTIPSEIYNSEDPFAASLTTHLIENENFRLRSDVNFSDFTYSDAVPNFCNFNNFLINIYPLVSVSMVNTSITFEFINVDDYIYYFDINQQLLIYQITEEKQIISKITLVNQYSLNMVINSGSYIKLINDYNASALYLVIDNQCKYYTLNSLFSPLFISGYYFSLRNISSIQTVDYTNGCFMFLMETKYIDMHCFNAIKSGFDVTQSVGETAARALLLQSNITVKAFNYTDMLIDENEVLIIADYNIGLICVDLRDKNSPKLIGIETMYGVTKLKRVYNSLMVIKQVSNGSLLTSTFEEYFANIYPKDNLFYLKRNTNFNLGYEEIKSLHAVRNYVLLLQTNAMKLYRHSISNYLDSEFIALQGFTNNGMLNMHRIDGISNKNLFIAVYPYKLEIYNIDMLNISLSCQAPLDYRKGNYLLNFTLASSSCSALEYTHLNIANFPACLLNVPTVGMVYEAGIFVEENDKTGMIVGLVVGLFFALLIIICCAVYLFRVSKKYDELEQRKGGHIQLAVGAGIIGGYEESEKQSNEQREDVNRLEIASNNQA